jgi:hypothetical protein
MWSVAAAALVLLSVLAPALADDLTTTADEVDGFVRQLDDASADKRRAAEVALYLISPDAFGALERAAGRPELPAGVKEKLAEIVARQRPWIVVRLRKEQTHQAEWKWNERTALEAYDRVGHRSPRWDADAREGIRLYTAPAAVSPKGAARPFLEKAIEAGCDDPLVLYLEARTLDQTPDPDLATLDRLYRMAAESMKTSEYPANRKCLAFMRYFGFKLRFDQQGDRPPAEVQEANQILNHLLAASVSLWPNVPRQEGIPVRFVMEVADEIMSAMDLDQAHRRAAFGSLYPSLAAAMPNSPIPLVFKGDFYIRWAWDARGKGWAAQVTPEGWKLMGERLAVAREALTQAWELDRSNSDAPALMLTVLLGQQADRATYELWFHRAMAADPDNGAACAHKLQYLLPKWNGSVEETLAFGRECVATNNWYGELPFMLVSAHRRLAEDLEHREEYFHNPLVWEDIRSVYVPYLAAKPKLNWARSEFAAWACQCGQWAEARRQFQLLGEKAMAKAFGGPKQMGEYRRQAFQNVSADTP